MLFSPKKIGSEFGGAFEALKPGDYAAREQVGIMNHSGPSLDYVPVKDGKSYPHPPLDDKVERLIESSWKWAQPKDGATRGWVQAGGHRAPARPMPPLPPLPGQARAMPPLPPLPGQVSTMPPLPKLPQRGPDTFHSAPAIDFGAKGTLAPHLKSLVPQDWSIMRQIPRVSAYAFRGDTRDPVKIQSAKGFNPPISRNDDYYVENVIFKHFAAYAKAKLNVDLQLADFKKLIQQAIPDPQDRVTFAYYNMWRSQVARESLHLGRMLAQEDLKGYISTTKSVAVAKGFARDGGYVYLMRVASGFLVPGKNSGNEWTKIFGEEEIASPFPIPWDDIMGYRKVKRTPVGLKFDGPVFLRRGFKAADSTGFETCFKLLSGKQQA